MYMQNVYKLRIISINHKLSKLQINFTSTLLKILIVFFYFNANIKNSAK